MVSLAVVIDQVGRAGRAVVAAVDAARRRELAVARDHHLHRIFQRRVGQLLRRRAAMAAGAGRVGDEAERLHPERMLQLVDLDAVAVHQARDHRDRVIDPAVRGRARRAAVGREHHAVDVARVVAPVVLAREHRHAGAEPGAAFGEAMAVAELGERRLRDVDEPLRHVGGRGRAAVREHRRGHHAVLAHTGTTAAGTIRRCAGCPCPGC